MLNPFATIFTGQIEFGQGSDTAMAQIAAQELGLRLEDIIVVSSDTAARQAVELGHSFRREMDLLALHGLLHLLGMDDAVPSDRKAMLRAAEEILEAFEQGGSDERNSKKSKVEG